MVTENVFYVYNSTFNSHNPSVITLDNGNFYVSTSQVIRTGISSIYGQIFDNSANKIGQAIPVVVTGCNVADPAAAQLGDGSIMNVWNAICIGNPGAGLYLQKINTNGQLINSLQFLANSSTAVQANYGNRIFIDKIDNDSYVVNWDGMIGSLADNGYISSFLSNNNNSGTNLNVLNDITSSQSDRALLHLSAGGYASSWVENKYSTIVKTQFFNETGPLSPAFETFSSPYSVNDPDMAELSNNQLLITWQQEIDTSNNKLVGGAIYSLTDNSLTSTNFVNQVTAFSQLFPKACYAGNDRFVTTWVEQSTPGSIYSQIYDTNCNRLGQIYKITDFNVTNSNFGNYDLACLKSNDDFVVIWEDQTGDNFATTFGTKLNAVELAMNTAQPTPSPTPSSTMASGNTVTNTVTQNNAAIVTTGPITGNSMTSASNSATTSGTTSSTTSDDISLQPLYLLAEVTGAITMGLIMDLI